MSEVISLALPRGWEIAPIDEILDVLHDGRTLHQGWSPQCESGPARSDDEWGVLKTTAIQAGAFLPEHHKRLPASLEPRPQIEVRPGDLLITCAGPRSRCGVACLVKTTRSLLMMSGKMYRFRVPEAEIDPRFIEGYLQSSFARDAIDDMKTGGSDSGLNLTHDRFRQLLVPIAPLKEQRRIVDALDELLSDLDAGIASFTSAREKLAAYRASVLNAAVTGALTAEWRAAHPDVEPASSLLDRILAERRRRWEEAQLAAYRKRGQKPPGNWRAKYREPFALAAAALESRPTTWQWASVEQLGEVKLGRQRAPQHHTGDHMRPYLRVANVYEDRLDLSDVKEMNFTPEEFETYALKYGDILLNEGQSPELVGRPAMYRDEIPGSCFQKTLLRFRAYPDVLPAYALLVFRSHLHSGRFRKSASITTSIAHLAAERFVTIEMPLPPLEEQQVIVDLVEEQHSIIDHLEAGIDAKLKSAQALRQSILHHAFTGRLVPQDPNDEPASELLKRIAAEREARGSAKKKEKRKRVTKTTKKRTKSA